MVDTTAIDYPEYILRFELAYILLSTSFNSRIKVKTLVDEITPIESMTSLYEGLN